MLAEHTPSRYATHEVINQSEPLEDYNLFATDQPLREGVRREGGEWAEDRLHQFGAAIGSREALEWGRLANENPPLLHSHDRFGHRIDEVEYHPAYHEMMRLGIEAETHSLPWNHRREGAHPARLALVAMLAQVEAGVGCPITMTFAAVPALHHQPEIADEWLPRITNPVYDKRFIPASQKDAAQIGMAMTEKQGGSDVRANTTTATPINGGGPGGEYELTGHKWFCSAPMSDAFLTLAKTDEGITCFLVPRFLPDGTRNNFYIQRLKNKLGNRSNASSEVEYAGTWARMVGPEGRGVPVIIEMVNHTRLDCAAASAGMMHQALLQAAHHCHYRSAFGRRLAEQPLMKNVLADLTVESEAATTSVMRLGRAYDNAGHDAEQRDLARIATAVCKYWICKRGPHMIYESLECLGGAGYVEESIMPRLYREAPLTSIWEGSGNVMCLDVLRAMGREPQTAPAFLNEVARAKGADPRLDKALQELEAELRDQAGMESRARRVVEKMAVTFQAAQLVQHGDKAVADAFCATRLERDHGYEYGTLPTGADIDAILARNPEVTT